MYFMYFLFLTVYMYRNYNFYLILILYALIIKYINDYFNMQISKASKLATWTIFFAKKLLLFTILYMPSVVWLIIYTF